jgi:hypothetical protein
MKLAPSLENQVDKPLHTTRLINSDPMSARVVSNDHIVGHVADLKAIENRATDI